MTALANVGSKLEAMQTRLEKNETATESMAEDLKSAVESLRAAEAAAAIAALPPTLATPAPAAPEVTPVAAPVPSPAPSVPEVHAPAAEVAPPVATNIHPSRPSRLHPWRNSGHTRPRPPRRHPRTHPRVRLPPARINPRSVGALRQRPATAPPPGAPAADAAVPGCAAQRTASAGRPTRPPPPPPHPPPPPPPSYPPAPPPGGYGGYPPQQGYPTPPPQMQTHNNNVGAPNGGGRAAREPEREGQRGTVHRRFREYGVHTGSGSRGDSGPERQRADGGHQRGAGQAHERQAMTHQTLLIAAK